MASKEVVFDLDAQAFASDEFRIYQFKVKRCPRSRPHDWTQCPFAHPGEKAKRRDPRRYRYSGTACPEFRRNGCCRRGDACPFAHGVFECWLHPSRYRTQMCTDGNSCKRRVCFFAHCEVELRKPEEDPVWLQQQLQAELAAEQHQHQQQQAISILAALLGTQKSGGDAASPATAASLASQPLASLLGLKASGSGAGAPSALPQASSDAQKAVDMMGSLQQGNSGGLTLLSLIDMLQKQQGTPPAAAAAPGASSQQPAPSSTVPAAPASDEGLQAQLSKLLLGGGSSAPSAPAAPAAPAAASSSKPRALDAEAPAPSEASASAPSAPIDVLSLLTSLAAPRSPSQAANTNMVSAMQQLLQPTLEPTSLLAALLSSKPAAADGSAPSVQASLAALLQQVAAAPQAAAAATKPASKAPTLDNGTSSAEVPAAAPVKAEQDSSSPVEKAAPGDASTAEPAVSAEPAAPADEAKP